MKAAIMFTYTRPAPGREAKALEAVHGWIDVLRQARRRR